MDLDFSSWNRIPLESLGLKQGIFKELGSTSYVERLTNLKVLGCRNLERFTGDNSRITRLIVEGCKKLDLRTIRTFPNIVSLIVNGNSNEVILHDIGETKRLKSLWLIDCKVHVAHLTFKHYFPGLTEIQISNLYNEQALEISRCNPGVHILGRTYTQ